MPSDTTALERDRISARVPKEVRERLEEAAELSGATLNQFLVQAAMKEADQILERERVIRLSACDSKWLLDLLDQPPKPPNAKLGKALADYYEATRGDTSRALDWPARQDEL